MLPDAIRMIAVVTQASSHMPPESELALVLRLDLVHPGGMGIETPPILDLRREAFADPAPVSPDS